MIDLHDGVKFVPLVQFVLRNGKRKKPLSPHLIFEVAGLKLSYDKMWFSGNFHIDNHRVSGKDWEIIISLFDPKRLATGKSAKLSTQVMVQFAGDRVYLTGVSVSNQEAIDRDLTLLRMFGIEELFSKG